MKRFIYWGGFPISRVGLRKTGVLALLVLLSVLCLSGGVFATKAEKAPKRVLVLHSYYQGYKWTDDENAGIESVLKPSIGATNLHIEYMDTKKVYGDLYSRRLYEVYKLKYRNFRFDLIITTDNNAFQFMRKYRDALFPGTPVVFCGVNNFQPADIARHKLFTGVNEESGMRDFISMILKLHPGTNQIAFVNEWTSTGRRVHQEFMAATAYFFDCVRFVFLEDMAMGEIVSQLEGMPPDTVVLYTSFSRDREGKVFEAPESASRIVPKCKVPIYTTHEFNIGHGVVGGLVLTGFDQGEAAARMALRILLGEKIEDIPPVMESPKHYMFDYRQMKRFNLAFSDLPKDSVVVNLPQSFYFKNRKWIDGLALVFISLLVIISILLYSIHKRKIAEKELKVSRGQLRTLAWRLAETEDAQRKSLSRELHDEIGQNLTILGVNLNILKSHMAEKTGGFVHTRINDSLAVVKQTTEKVRSLMNNLRSPVLDDYGLIAAVELYGKQFAARTGIGVTVRGPRTDAHLPPHIENAMFKIVQESLTNVVKHSQAEQVTVNIDVSKKRLALTVKDNGIGYDAAKPPKPGGLRGWGLITMTERALAVGGTCRVESHPGTGTNVTVEVQL